MLLEKEIQLLKKGLQSWKGANLAFMLKKKNFQELLNIRVNKKTKLEAFIFLVKNQSFTRAFFAIPHTRRYEMLLKLMNSER